MRKSKLSGRKSFIPLKTDFSIKEVFENETVRRYFIRDALGIPLEEIKSVRLMNPALPKLRFPEKQGILDILLELNNDTKINIELQLVNQKDWDKRQLFYLSKIYTADLRRGENYDRAKRCIAISILDFNFTGEKEYHNIYRFRNKKGREFSNMMEIHTIELRKMLTGEDALDDWVRLFNAGSEEELDMIKTGNTGIQEAIRELKRMSFMGNIRALYESRLKYKRDLYGWKEYVREEAQKEGLEKGRAEGHREGVQLGIEKTAERMLAMQMDISVIASATNLSEERIKQIADKIRKS